MIQTGNLSERKGTVHVLFKISSIYLHCAVIPQLISIEGTCSVLN